MVEAVLTSSGLHGYSHVSELLFLTGQSNIAICFQIKHFCSCRCMGVCTLVINMVKNNICYDWLVLGLS